MIAKQSRMLMKAAELKDVQAVKQLIASGVEINDINEHGDTALTLASARLSNAAVIGILLRAGANIDHQNGMGRTALIEAAAIGCLENAKGLLSCHPSLNLFTGEGETALTFAVVNESVDIVRLLLGAGADADMPDAQGWSPLTYAIYGGNLNLSNLLLNAGASPFRVDAAGVSMLQYAMRTECAELIARVQSSMKRRLDPRGLIAQIEAAFAAVALEDGVSLHMTAYLDGYRSDERLLESARRDERDDWRLISDTELERFTAVFSFTDGKGFRFYLPAFMRWCVQNPHANGIIGDHTVYALNPQTIATLYQRTVPQILDARQIDVVIRFLEWCFLKNADHRDADVAWQHYPDWCALLRTQDGET
jgi:hypothetical protein